MADLELSALLAVVEAAREYRAADVAFSSRYGDDDADDDRIDAEYDLSRAAGVLDDALWRLDHGRSAPVTALSAPTDRSHASALVEQMGDMLVDIECEAWVAVHNDRFDDVVALDAGTRQLHAEAQSRAAWQGWPHTEPPLLTPDHVRWHEGNDPGDER